VQVVVGDKCRDAAFSLEPFAQTGDYKSRRQATGPDLAARQAVFSTTRPQLQFYMLGLALGLNVGVLPE
jgi:hypothetical protein